MLDEGRRRVQLAPRCYRPAAVTRLYDLMILIDSSAPEERQQAIVAEIEGALTSGGNIVGSHDWGTRKITFEIDHRPEAAYRLYQFEGDAPLLERLNHSLKIMDGVLRFRIIRQPPGSPPVPPGPEPVRAPHADEPDGRVAARAAADAAPEQPETTE
jgi:small subunit ribosomal protein S6